MAVAAVAEGDAPPKKSKKKLIIMLVAVLAIGGGAYFFFLKPKPAKAVEPIPGEVIVTEPIQVNLADGHYLRIGIALQAVEGAGGHGPLDASKALDYTIETFSGRTVGELSDHKQRYKLKKELLHHIEEAYHHEIIDVYFTEFVTQ